MLAAQLLAAFALLCGLVAAAIVVYACWADADSRLRKAQAELDVMAEGDFAEPMLRDELQTRFHARHAASLDAERREERGANIPAPFTDAMDAPGACSEVYEPTGDDLRNAELLDSVPGWSTGFTLRESLSGLAPEVVADVMADPEHYLAVPPEGSYPAGFDGDDPADAIAIAEGYPPCECGACRAMLVGELDLNATEAYFEPLASARVNNLDATGREALRVLLADVEFRTPLERALDWALDEGIRRRQLTALHAVADDLDDIPF